MKIIEEKAKAYDEAVNKLRRFIEQGVDPLITRADVQDFFPELKESEDEKVRKGIIELVKQSSEILNKKNQERMLAWLEKQGQVKESTISQHENRTCEENDDSLTSEGEKMMKEIIELVMRPTWKTEKEFHRRHELCAWLERQGEHANFRNKIQVGDKVTRNEYGVLVNLSQLNRVAKPRKKQGENSIRWNENTDDNKPQKHHSVLMKTTHGIAEGEWQGVKWFQYRWSSRLKDSDVLFWIELSDIEKQGEQKPEENKGNIGGISANWSEEDNNILNGIIAYLSCTACNLEGFDRWYDWLKSLRPQNHWKPSETDITILEDVFNGKINPKDFQVTLLNVLEQLKKLKEKV